MVRYIDPPIADAGPVSVPEDVARSAGTGAVEGAAGLTGILGDVRKAGDWAQGKLAGWMGQKGSAPLGPIGPSPVIDILSRAVAAKEAQLGADPRIAHLVTALTLPGAMLSAPTSKDTLGAMTQDKPLYQPQTRQGRYARTIAQNLPSGLMPGSIPQRVANVVLPGIASEAAGEATKGTALEPYARMAAAVAASGGVAAASHGGARTKLLADASRGATDAQVAEARALMEEGQRQGVRLTMAEALQQVTGGATGMGRMQRIVEGTPRGAEAFNPVMAARPGQVRGAITSFADTIAPATDQPSMLGAEAQQAAEGGLSDIRQGINASARPFYDALPGQTMGEADYARLAADPSYRTALKTLRSHPELGARVAGLPDNDLSVVNEVIKRLNTAAEQVRPGPMNVQGADNTLAALRDTAAGTATQAGAAASPDFAAARQVVAAGRAADLEPLQRGPVGRIAGTPDVRAQTAALFPSAPAEGTAAETAAAIRAMGGAGSDVARGLVRQHLMNTANEATQDLQGGPNQWAGAKWAATQMGNPEQAAALQAGVEGVGGDPRRLNNLVQVLRATGQRERPGSLTTFNNQAMEELGTGGVSGETLKAVASGPGFFRWAGNKLQNWQTETNAARLADAILADPAHAEEILMRARAIGLEGQDLRTIQQLALTAQENRRERQ